MRGHTTSDGRPEKPVNLKARAPLGSVNSGEAEWIFDCTLTKSLERYRTHSWPQPFGRQRQRLWDHSGIANLGAELLSRLQLGRCGRREIQLRLASDCVVQRPQNPLIHLQGVLYLDGISHRELKIRIDESQTDFGFGLRKRNVDGLLQIRVLALDPCPVLTVDRFHRGAQDLLGELKVALRRQRERGGVPDIIDAGHLLVQGQRLKDH